MMVKIGAKKVAGLEVSIPNRAVNVVDSAKRFHRGSRQWLDALVMTCDWLKSNAIGKFESYAMLLMPFLEMAGKLFFSPISETTPQPP